jgi:hypothetical protein
MKLKLLAVALSLSLGASVAGAADSTGGERRGDRIAKLDVNKDGQISREEAAAAPRLAQRFDQLDANKDGQLTREEFASARRARSNQAPPVKP